MPKVAVLFTVYPKDNNVDLAVKNIKEKMNPPGMQVDDIAFGIKVIKVMFKFDDAETNSSKIEEELRHIEGVGELEVVEEGLL